MNTTMKRFTIKKNQTRFTSTKITKSAEAEAAGRQFFGSDIGIYESFMIMMLDRANNTVGYAKISQGGIVGTVVDVKIIAKYCLDALCSSVVLYHNHPSGNLKPSESDKVITKRIKDALKLIEVEVIEHIILTEESFYSFADNGQIN